MMALRLASSDILPFDPPMQAAALEGYVDALTPPPPSAAAIGTNAVDGDADSGDDSGFGAKSSGNDASTAAAAAATAKTSSAAGVVTLSEADLAPLKDAVAAFRVAADEVGSWSDTAPSSSKAATARVPGSGGGGGDGGGGSSSSSSGREETEDDVEGVSVPPVAASAAARAFALRGAGAGATTARQAPADEHREAGRNGGGGTSGEHRGGGGDVYLSAAERLRIEDLNDRLAMTERRFLVAKGLPGRQWYRHVLQAPGLYLGCDLAIVFVFVFACRPGKVWDNVSGADYVARMFSAGNQFAQSWCGCIGRM